MQDSVGSTTLDSLKGLLRHPDPFQLDVQLIEIVQERSYLQGGIEVHPGDVVVDVGANVGVASAFFASECGASLVHSFEPVPAAYEVLEKNLRHFPACHPHGYGMSSTSGTTSITWYPANWMLSGEHAELDADRSTVRQILLNIGAPEESVDDALADSFETEVVECEMRTLTDAIREESIDAIDLLKIDVEGAEREVLAGIADADWHRIRQIAAELHLDEGGRRKVVALLEGRGFRINVTQHPTMRGTRVHMLYARRP